MSVAFDTFQEGLECFSEDEGTPECIVGDFKTITPGTIAGILSVMPYNAAE